MTELCRRDGGVLIQAVVRGCGGVPITALRVRSGDSDIDVLLSVRRLTGGVHVADGVSQPAPGITASGLTRHGLPGLV
ncbi:MAG: hypothetical protein V9F82_04515 [Dermatophilaceae bacterium]